ncbi:hypothetical protein OG786_30230 [Streptomyces sp. NBC_00101]|uniref:hypothetical protein n=1 Tax=Streptomyces sp. NBC_00101 TaxID=2975651 RepID=UPI00324773D7
MRLTIDVREGDWSVVSYGSYGARFSHTLDTMIAAGEFEGDSTGRWHELGRRTGQGTFTLSVPDGDRSTVTVGELTVRCLTEARSRGAARPAPVVPGRGSPRRSPRDDDAVLGVWLSDAATDERLAAGLTLDRAGLRDGDLLVLSVEYPAQACYEMGAPRNPDQLFRWLQLAEHAAAPSGGPRLWGVLLYTDADVELATYVRTHFDDLNALSGPATRVFVVERRADWPRAKKYWRRHLEPELYRVMSVMHWLRWTPYDPQGAYEVAARLGLDPQMLPCLVFFRPPGAGEEHEKAVFRIEHTSTAYFRTLFGSVNRALRSVTSTGPSSEEAGTRPARYGPASERGRGASPSPRTDTCAPAADAVEALLSSGPVTDDTALRAVREAETAIKAELAKLVPPPPGLTVSNSLVVLPRPAGAAVPDNFSFHGEHTTFVNRPRSTVIRDFQNTYATAAHAEDLVGLLRLVLESRDTPEPAREEAAAAIHDLARLGAEPEHDGPAATARLERLRTLLASSADIAQPALTILASLGTFFAG